MVQEPNGICVHDLVVSLCGGSITPAQKAQTSRWPLYLDAAMRPVKAVIHANCSILVRLYDSTACKCPIEFGIQFAYV